MKAAAMRALIVEDDASWQQILVEIITDAGLAVDTVADLEQATACLRAVPHRIAVVDLSLCSRDPHNQDGLAVLDALRRHDPECVSMLLTGFATVELAVQALTEYGALTCLRKETFNRAEFRALIQQALASARHAGRPAEGAGAAAPDSIAGSQAHECGLALVVDDDAGWRAILSELLSDAGYRVHSCAGYGEALGRLRRETYSLAVVDLALEGSSGDVPRPWHDSLDEDESLLGYRLLASTRAGGVPTFVVSGVATPAEIERVYDEHAVFAFFEKRAFDRRTFLHTVAEAQTGAPLSLELLTDRERQVLQLLAQGLTNKEIAETLVITTNTVKRHLKAIFRKLEVHTRSAAAAKAISAGVSVDWLEEEDEDL